MIKYVFRDRPITIKQAASADPQKIGEALAKIKKQTAGICSSKTVLQAARDKRNYLHRFFEWRNDVAAEKYRQEQAREIVSMIDIVDDSGIGPKRVPAFVSINQKQGRGYYTAADVLSSTALSDLLLRQCEAEMEAMERRLMSHAEICAAVRRAREMVRERRERYAAAGGNQPFA